MKKTLYAAAVAFLVIAASCKKSDFAESYANPSKISATSVEKQFTGTVASLRDYVVPSYWNYFVVLRTTVNRFTQATGWVNASTQYVPGGAGVTDRWNAYYNFLSQYRELQKVYAAQSAEDQADRRIYMIAAAIFFYDQTQKMVDLHGDIPWSQAGMLSANGGDYNASLPKYDDAASVYTKMLDDLKGFADELNSTVVKSGILTGFKTQDLINKGDLTLWKKYCNSVRIRMLSRVSGVAAFQSRVGSEMAALLADPGKYPVVSANADNIKIDVFNLNSDINSKGFQSGLEDWDGNIAGKAMIDGMKAAGDPRLRVMFEPGARANGAYNGLDPVMNASAQTALVSGGTLSIYNRSTISRNQYFPGMLINAAEVSFYLSEYYLKAANLSAAKTAYENGVRQSIDYYYWLRSLSNDNTAGSLTPLTPAEVSAYLLAPGTAWDMATTPAARLNLIATQKWIHYSVVQPLESWAEYRRLDAPALSFWNDNASTQALPPNRWLYPSSEQTYNAANYNAVRGKDNLTTKIFWDM